MAIRAAVVVVLPVLTGWTWVVCSTGRRACENTPKAGHAHPAPALRPTRESKGHKIGGIRRIHACSTCSVKLQSPAPIFAELWLDRAFHHMARE